MSRKLLRKRFGHAGRRSEGVKVKREKDRLYYVGKNGVVMSSRMRNA